MLDCKNILDEGGEGIVELVVVHAVVGGQVQLANELLHVPDDCSAQLGISFQLFHQLITFKVKLILHLDVQQQLRILVQIEQNISSLQLHKYQISQKRFKIIHRNKPSSLLIICLPTLHKLLKCLVFYPLHFLLLTC